ncbi:MAG: hypothetical protein ACTSVL_06355 [Promethearchaeota archaeon]
MAPKNTYEELQSEISELESRAILLYIDNVDMNKAIEMLDSDEIERYNELLMKRDTGDY